MTNRISAIRRPGTPILTYSTPNGDMEGARHSYVEGEDYEDTFSEIEAMGGGMRKRPFELFLKFCL